MIFIPITRTLTVRSASTAFYYATSAKARAIFDFYSFLPSNILLIIAVSVSCTLLLPARLVCLKMKRTEIYCFKHAACKVIELHYSCRCKKHTKRDSNTKFGRFKVKLLYSFTELLFVLHFIRTCFSSFIYSVFQPLATNRKRTEVSDLY